MKQPWSDSNIDRILTYTDCRSRDVTNFVAIVDIFSRCWEDSLNTGIIMQININGYSKMLKMMALCLASSVGRVVKTRESSFQFSSSIFKLNIIFYSNVSSPVRDFNFAFNQLGNNKGSIAFVV